MNYRHAMTARFGRGVFAIAAGVAALLGGAALAAECPRQVKLTVRADAVDCHYASGETAVLTVTACGTNGVALTEGRLTVWADNFGDRLILATNVVDLAQGNPFKVSASRTTPGFVRFGFRSADESAKVLGQWGNGEGTMLFGVGYDLERIASGTPNPADFDTFWEDAIRKLDETVPEDAKMELVAEKSKGEFNSYRVSFATHGGRRVYGWVVEPKDTSKGPYPVKVNVPGAGMGQCDVPAGQPGRVVLLMNVHSWPLAEGWTKEAEAARKEAYAAQDMKFGAPCGVEHYWHAGVHLSREEYFYYATILGINRAVNWLVKRPECDCTRVSYSGTSQGGGFGLMLTALNPHITRSVIFVPAITDLLGYRVEQRRSGWPRLIEAQKPENRDAAERNAPYFCGVNFARRIKTPIRFVAGFADNVCPPAAVYSAFNACPSSDKVIYDGVGMGHGVFDDYYRLLLPWQDDYLPTPDRDEGLYRFLAFNIWGDYFGNPVEERDHPEAEIVKKWKPDFAGFQEVTVNFWNSRLFKELEGEYVAIGRDIGPGGWWKHAADPVLYRKSRFDLVDSGAVWYCPELDGSKGAVWAVLKDKRTKRNIAIFASHFWWRTDGEGDDWIRLNNAQKLRAKMFELKEKYDAAIIGGGDLNSPMTEAGMKYLVGHGLADAQETAKVSPKDFPSEHGDPVRDAKRRYRGTNAARGHNPCRPRSWFLDHIFYDPTRIVVERFALDVSPEACGVSDHHPVITDFRLKD